MQEIIGKSGFIGYILIAVVIFSTAVIVYKFYVFRKWEKNNRASLFKEILEEIKKALSKSFMNKKEISLLIEAELSPQKRKLQKYLSTLASIATVAPLLGLLGTILGMIHSTKGILKVDNNMLLRGISEALLTTAIGIVIAIPVILIYNYFVGKTQKIVEDFKENILKELDQ